MSTYLAIGALVIVALLAIWAFNRLISLKVRAANAWSDIDVQLKRRTELIPALVQTVRGYAAHEKSTLERVVAARSCTESTHSPVQRGQAESEVSRGISQIFALAEAYPDLKADQMFISLHDNLVQTEGAIQSARRYYNAVVRDLNTSISVFPISLVAGAMRLKPREFFELETTKEAGVPSVNLKEA